MENASASGSSKSQMLPSPLPLPASFFKVLPLPQKFNRFQLTLSLPHPSIVAHFFQTNDEKQNNKQKL